MKRELWLDVADVLVRRAESVRLTKTVTWWIRSYTVCASLPHLCVRGALRMYGIGTTLRAYLEGDEEST